MNGKDKRLANLRNKKSNNMILMPMDHGMTIGPVDGIVDVRDTIRKIEKTEIDTILMHKGLIRNCCTDNMRRDLGIVMHLSASTQFNPHYGHKAIVGTVLEAVFAGCDGVSVHLNIGDDYETDMLRDIGRISMDCYQYGMPLIIMAYARGKNIENECDFAKVRQAARVAAELGADVVKVNYTGSQESFREVVQGCPVPVVIAGGEKTHSEKQLLIKIDQAMKAGARGVSIGRNIFQSPNMEHLVTAIHEIVNLNYEMDKVLADFEKVVTSSHTC